MQLKLSQLQSHLGKQIAPVYLLHGDEPLLQIEAAQSIREAAMRAGFVEREVMVADAGFDWALLSAANMSMSLFGSRRVLDLRLPTGKPGKEGGEVLETVGANPSPDNVLMVSCPRLDRAGTSSGWFSGLEAAGVAIAIPPIERDDLPAWIAQRLSRNDQRGTNDVLQYLADLTEGNLLAAQQEIDKLALLLPSGEITQEQIESVVANVARYDNAELSAALLEGNIERTCKILSGLQAEGEAIQLVLWQIADDTHGLLTVAQAVRDGQMLSNALRNARVWGRRQAPMEKAARRVDGRALSRLVPELARLDRISKGIGKGEIWDETRAYALRFIATMQRSRPRVGDPATPR
ncbi:MAG: DNA polymerase III subunit delta [Betaproteobacteria bacterium]